MSLLRLTQHDGGTLMSRSQARQVASGFEGLTSVELDFADVEWIGPSFADELFRVYARAHPEIRITAVNTTTAVDMMIRRAMNAPVVR